jgi:hypothetical protein
MNYKGYKEGVESELGIKIHRIIAISPDVVTYFDDSYGLVFEFEPEKIKTDSAKVKLLHQTLYEKIPEGISKGLEKKLLRELGHCLFSAFEAENYEASEALFEPFIEKVERVKSPEFAILEYTIISAVLTIVFSSALAWLYFNLIDTEAVFAMAMLCGAGGVVGSLFSTLQRQITINLDLMASRAFVVMQSLIRVISGLLAAIILFLASKSDIALGFAKDNPYTLLLFCVLAGFSERLIPDLFNKLSKEVQ